MDGAIERTDSKMPNARMNTTPTYLPDPPTCHIYDSGNGTVTVVDASQKPLESNDYVNYGPVEVSVYDATDFHRISTMTLPEELPRFGAFLAYGQENDAEDDSLEVVRIVKYDHDWNRLGAASMCDSEEEYTQMTIPFFHGASMVEQDGMLGLHMGMHFYRDRNGTTHQGSRTYGFYMDTYTRETGYVGAGTSHSLGSAVLGQDGAPTGQTGTLPGYSTSTCLPAVVGDQLMWYANLNSTRYFYTLPLSKLD